MRTLCLTAMVAAAGACNKWAATAMPAPQVQVAGTDSVAPHQWDRVRLHLNGGEVLVLRNAARVSDSIRGLPDVEVVDTVASRVSVPIKAVTRFEIRRTDPVRTGIFLGVAAGLIALGASIEPMSGGFNVSVPCGLLGEPCPHR